MFRTTRQWSAIVFMLGISLSGCGYFGGAAVDEDADLTELENAKSTKANSEISMDDLPEERDLELKLNVGDRFPLTKTVEQRLTQTDSSGINVNTSKTDMLLSLVVDKVQDDGRKQLTVRYHRVQYEQDIRGRKVFYHSEKTTDQVPPEALLYAGLANNGFSFWLGPDNKIIDIIGFNEFLRRCLMNVPGQYIAGVQRQLEMMKSEDGIANFVDESIGLLPFSTDPTHPAVAVKEGTTWELPTRQTDYPFPTRTTMKCTLKDLTTHNAEIVLLGRISGPGNVITMPGPEGDMKVFVRGGQCTGTCEVDRQTGLPTRSQLQRTLDMMIEMPDGQRVQQSKEILSTITSFLDQSPKSSTHGESAVQQTQFLKSPQGGDRSSSDSSGTSGSGSSSSERKLRTSRNDRREGTGDGDRPRRFGPSRKF